jgi:hypothetical protein
VEVDDPALTGSVDASVAYVLAVTDVNEAPSELFLSNFRISTSTNASTGPVFVGKFVAIDPDRSTSGHVFSLVTGAGDADNNSFQVSGNSLSLKQGMLIPPVGSTYSIRARLADGPFMLEQSFELLVTGNIVVNHVWHNTNRPFDVRGGNSIEPDNFVDAGDVLAIINYINSVGAGPVPANAQPGLPFGFLDTDNDNNVAANDALEVINAINSGQGGEGEPAGGDNDPASEPVEDPLLSLLAADVASRLRRPRIYR